MTDSKDIALDESKPTINMLVEAIDSWGLAHNITADGGATPEKQLEKLLEEYQETIIALTEFRCVSTEFHSYVEDGMGDMLVCIIQAMRLAGTDMETCLTKAWHDIKDRKGTMINGKFVKET